MPALEYHSTSSSRLKGARQKHQNTVRFNPHRHDPENVLPPQVMRMVTSLCCRRCQLILRWKLDYGKYPSMTTIRKSVRTCGACHEKNVAIPFHHMCQSCARELAVCAKCQKTPEESEKLASAARQRASRNVNADDDGGDDAEEEEEEEEEECPIDEAENEADAEAAAARAAKREEDRLRQEQDEADFPELALLRGLDLSVLRAKLHEERKNSSVSALNTQGKLRERERRTAMRMMNKGDESGAAGVINAVVGGAAGGRGGNEDGGDDDDKDATAEKKQPDTVKKAAVVADAGATSSDEETI